MSRFISGPHSFPSEKVPMRLRLFTSGIVTHRGSILVLKRKEDDDTYPGLWDCPGGHFERGESAKECMLRETLEECGLRPEVRRVGRLIEYRDAYGRSVSVPFLLESSSRHVRLTEHDESRWVSSVEARELDSVPSLRLAMDDFGL